MIFGYANRYVGYMADCNSFEYNMCEKNPSVAHLAGKYTGGTIIAAGEKLIRKNLETTFAGA
ncbi:MAG: hypothetical protein K8S55_05060 [Phycisphaerae bacterium]|nr:hypothetical protein [Phycisphaerae bacterium]